MENLMPENQENIEEELKNVGERLALLLAAANMPDDVKQAWAALVPKMSLEQIDRFAKALEQQMVSQGSEEITQLADSIEAIKRKRAEAQKVSNDQAQAALNEIERAIDEAEQQ